MCVCSRHIDLYFIKDKIPKFLEIAKIEQASYTRPHRWLQRKLRADP